MDNKQMNDLRESVEDLKRIRETYDYRLSNYKALSLAIEMLKTLLAAKNSPVLGERRKLSKWDNNLIDGWKKGHNAHHDQTAIRLAGVVERLEDKIIEGRYTTRDNVKAITALIRKELGLEGEKP